MGTILNLRQSEMQFKHTHTTTKKKTFEKIMGKCTFENRLICLVGRVIANSPGDRGSVPGRVIPNTLKMLFDTSMLNTQHYKVRIKGKVEQSRERRCSWCNDNRRRKWTR